MEESFKRKSLEFWLNENLLLKAKLKLVNLNCFVKIVILCCRTLPLFIGDENWLTKVKRVVGEKPKKIESEKYSCWESVRKSDCCRSTGSVDRQRSDFQPLGRRSTETVGRSPKQRVSLSVGRPVRSTEEKQRASYCSRSTVSVDRCAHMHSGECRSTGPVDRKRQKLFLPKAIWRW